MENLLMLLCMLLLASYAFYSWVDRHQRKLVLEYRDLAKEQEVTIAKQQAMINDMLVYIQQGATSTPGLELGQKHLDLAAYMHETERVQRFRQ